MHVPSIFTRSLAGLSSGTTFEAQNCTASQVDVMSNAIDQATICLNTILQDHSGIAPISHSSDLRTRYFGNLTDDEFANTVTDTFSRIQNGWSNMTFHCPQPDSPYGKGCTDGKALAVTVTGISWDGHENVSAKAEEIIICPDLFTWTGDHDLATTQMMTMIHEMTHAFAIPKTQDINIQENGPCLGEWATQQLACWSPTLAGRNADNFARYANAMCAATTKGVSPAQKIACPLPDDLVGIIQDVVERTAWDNIRAQYLKDFKAGEARNGTTGW